MPLLPQRGTGLSAAQRLSAGQRDSAGCGTVPAAGLRDSGGCGTVAAVGQCRQRDSAGCGTVPAGGQGRSCGGTARSPLVCWRSAPEGFALVFTRMCCRSDRHFVCVMTLTGCLPRSARPAPYPAAVG